MATLTTPPSSENRWMNALGWIFLAVVTLTIGGFVWFARQHPTPPTPQNLSQGTLGFADTQAVKQLQVQTSDAHIVQTWPSLGLEGVIVTLTVHNPTNTPVAIPLGNVVTLPSNATEYTNPVGQVDMVPVGQNQFAPMTVSQIASLHPSLWPVDTTAQSIQQSVLRIPAQGTVSGQVMAPVGLGWHQALIDVLSAQTGDPSMINIAVVQIP